MNEGTSKLTCTDINHRYGKPYGLENELPEMQTAWVFEKLVDALDCYFH